MILLRETQRRHLADLEPWTICRLISVRWQLEWPTASATCCNKHYCHRQHVRSTEEPNKL